MLHHFLAIAAEYSSEVLQLCNILWLFLLILYLLTCVCSFYGC